MTTTPAPLLTVREAAAELGLTVRAVQHRIQVGTLEARKYGTGRTSQYLIARSELQRVKQASK